jgi:arsenite methyltransferase
MSDTGMTSTGHAVSDAPWLDLHFQVARAEYEEALRFVGIKPGWTVLDAGCGSGGYVPLLGELVGPTGQVAALDLAPENVTQVERIIQDGHYAAPWSFASAACWTSPLLTQPSTACGAPMSPNLTEAEFTRVMGEFRRVTKPGGLVAVKHSDGALLQLLPLDPAIWARHVAVRRAKAAETGVLGAWCGSSLARFFWQAGLTEIARKGWLVERWAPVQRMRASSTPWACAIMPSSPRRTACPRRTVRRWLGRRPIRTACSMIPTFASGEVFVVTLGRVPA